MRNRPFSKRLLRSRRSPIWLRAGAVPLVGASEGGEDALLDLLHDETLRVPAAIWLLKESSEPPVERVVQELRRAVYGSAPAQYIPPSPREMIELDLWIAPQFPVHELLIDALDDSEPEIRERAAVLLGDRGNCEDVPRLRRLADDESDSDVRMAASLAMRRIERRG